jgi:hypothetical protein
MAESEDCMPSGDPQRTWFPEMIQKLRFEWHESMLFPELIALCNSLDSMLHEIRSTRNIRSPIVKCPKCGKVGPAAERHVSVRAMILSLSRFNIVDAERVKILEKKWAVYREKNGLNLYGKADSGEPRSRDGVDSDAQ